MLTVDSAAHFLIDRGLIDHEWILEGGLTIQSAARRNRNLRVDGPAGGGYLIKQPGDVADGSRETLRCEAAFYRFCREEPGADPVTRILPRLVATDLDDALLVFESIPGATPFSMYLYSEDGPRLAAEPARAFGHALGTAHRVLSACAKEPDARLVWLPRALPWVMRLHKPWPGLLASLNPAGYEMLRVLQNPDGLSERLGGLSRHWQPTTMIHGDVRLDNVLVRSPRPAGEPGAVELWIVDWEMVSLGDPAWDLAGALQDFLVFWVSSITLADEMTAEQMIAEARVPLHTVQTAVRALWAGYCEGACLDSAQGDDVLMRAVPFSAARLIQSALERSDETDRLAGSPVVLLQISANLLAEPESGQVELYGIPPRQPDP
jgi:hypothetical protein